MAHRRHHHAHRRRNPFASGSFGKLGVKVVGALGGGIAAATIPNAVMPSMATGWAGVGAALVIAFGGAWLTKGMSADLSEGVLIGGAVQAAGRIGMILTGKNFASFGMGTYGPMRFPVPTPAWRGSPASQSPQIPASAAVTKAATKPAMGKYSASTSKWAA